MPADTRDRQFYCPRCRLHLHASHVRRNEQGDYVHDSLHLEAQDLHGRSLLQVYRDTEDAPDPVPVYTVPHRVIGAPGVP